MNKEYINFIDWNCGKKNAKKFLVVSDATYADCEKIPENSAF